MWGWIAIGTGAVGLVNATTFLALGISNRIERENLMEDSCVDSLCSSSSADQAQDLKEEGDLYNGMAIGSFVYGAAAITTGLVLLNAGKSREKHAVTWGPVAWTPSITTRGIQLQGNF